MNSIADAIRKYAVHFDIIHKIHCQTDISRDILITASNYCNQKIVITMTYITKNRILLVSIDKVLKRERILFNLHLKIIIQQRIQNKIMDLK